MGIASITRAHFVNGNESGGVLAGYQYYGGHYNYVTRFTILTDSSGATELSFSAEVTQNDDGSTSGDTVRELRYALTEADDSYLNYHGTAGTAITTDQSRWNTWEGKFYRNLSGTITRNLLPNHSYYLWIFTGTTTKNVWTLNGTPTVTAAGTYGAASTVSAEDGSFGDTVRINIERVTEDVRHTVTVRGTGTNGTVYTVTLCTKAEAWPYITWTPKVSYWAPKVTDSDRVTITITAETFLGDVSFGTESCSITMRFKAADVAPAPGSSYTANWAVLSAVNGGGLSGYIQNHSKVSATFYKARISCKYGATISGYEIKVSGSTATGSPGSGSTKQLTPAGALKAADAVELTVTDSRGMQYTERRTASPFYSYSMPELASGAAVERADSQGAAAEDGTYAAIECRALIASLGGQNTASVTARSKEAEASAYGSETALTLKSGETDIFEGLIGGFSADRTYDLQLTITDALGNSRSFSYRIATQAWAMKFNSTGTAVGFGKAPEEDKVLEIPEDWKIRRGSGYALFEETGTQTVGTITWRWRKRPDGFTELWGSGSIAGYFISGGTTAEPVYYTGTMSEALPFAVTPVFAAINIGEGNTTWGNITRISGTSMEYRVMAASANTYSAYPFTAQFYIAGIVSS